MLLFKVLKENNIENKKFVLENDVRLILNRVNEDLSRANAHYYFRVESSDNGVFNLIKIIVNDKYKNDPKYIKLVS